MVFAALSILIQLALLAHAVQTGRGRNWRYAIVFLPGIGPTAYVLTQVLPDLFGRRRASDPRKMLRAAKRQFEAGDFGATVQTLDQLIAAHPDFRSASGHLLYARALTELGRHSEALEEFEALVQYDGCAEAHVRYAQLLEELGRPQQARRIYRDVLARAKESDRKDETVWIERARQALS